MTIPLVTGANRGLGYETARRLVEAGQTVYLGARDPERGAKAAAELGARYVQLDVTDDNSVRAALRTIADDAGGLDVLVNNAGIAEVQGPSEADTVTGESALRQFDTNAVGVVRVTTAALPLLRASANPVVVNVSSALGSFWAVTNPQRRQFHYPSIVYGATKAAVSMLTVQYAKAVPEVRFNAVEPGFTATDFTAGIEGGRPVEQSAEVIVRLATIDADGPTGTFTEDDHTLPW
jgi:NAD(P)-dependent dehydrogenase (short-subunit alcohol dehydrogenase family)